eukprot:gene36302-48882_t
MDIDLVWHAHQTDPSSYNTYTRAMLGRLLNHDDTIGADDLGKGYARTFIFWAQAYKEPYSSTKPTFGQWQRGHNIVSLVVPPVGIYRLYVWNKFSNLAAPVVPVAEKVDPHGGGNPISVVGVPVMEPGTVPRNQLSRNAVVLVPVGPLAVRLGLVERVVAAVAVEVDPVAVAGDVEEGAAVVGAAVGDNITGGVLT